MITLISMVNDDAQYNECILKSTENCKHEIEYMPLRGVTHPTKAYNQAIQDAQHNLIVCCHQDIIFFENLMTCLERSLNKIPNWGVCGLAGTTYNSNLVLFNFHPQENYTAPDHKAGEITKVVTLDGCCVILDKSKGLRFDEQNVWWHFYGVDISLQARDRGLEVYVIPCRSHHISLRTHKSLSDGGGYIKAFQLLKQKWSKYSPIYTTVGTI